MLVSLVGCASGSRETAPPETEPVAEAVPEQETIEVGEEDGELDMTLADTPVDGGAVAQPQRPPIGSFKLCGSGKEEGCGPEGVEEMIP